MNKPKFDPSQPFQEVSKPKFDPSKPFEPAPEEKEGKFDLESSIVDQLPTLGATAGGLVGGFLGNIPGGLAGAGAGGYLGKATQNIYNSYRHPEKAPQNNLDIIKQPLEAGLEGTSDQALGDVGGALIGKLLPYASKLTGPLGKKLKEMAEKLAARSLGAERGTIKKLGPEKVLESGRYALDNDIIKPFSNAEDLIAANKGVQEQAGQRMGNVYSQIDKHGGSTFNPTNVAADVENQLGNFWRSPINKGITSQFDDTLESIMMRGGGSPDRTIPLQTAQALKEELGGVANWKNNISTTDKERIARQSYGIVNDAIDRSVQEGADNLGIPGLKEELGQAKNLYGNSKTAENLLENKYAREQGNKMFGLTDTITGAGIASGVDAPAALATVTGKKALERYGHNIGALSLDKIGDYVSQSPQLFGKFAPLLQQAAQRGPTAVGATNFILQQTQPEYQKLMQDFQQEEN